MKCLIFLLSLAGFAAGTAAAGAEQAPAPFAHLAQTEVRVVTAQGEHEFWVWIADDDRSRTQGLMFIKELPANRGMLFLFDRPHFASFWMKNTYLSLDIIFIAPGGAVTNIARDTTPLSTHPIVSEAPVAAVLELNAGTARRIGLQAGDRIHFAAPSGAAVPPGITSPIGSRLSLLHNDR